MAQWIRSSRKLHFWSAIITLVPIVIVIGSGILLQVKKEIHWVQPPTMKGQGVIPSLPFQRIIDIARQIPQAEISSWKDIDRLDVRPNKGIIKIRSVNNFEAQIDSISGEVLSVQFRRSDIIESIHDGSWFFEGAKLWIFLPASLLLALMWITGLVVAVKMFLSKYRHTKRLRSSNG